MVINFAIKSAIKVGIVGSAVFYTNQLEIWNRLSVEPVAYDRALADVKKYIDQVTPESLSWPAVIDSGNLCSLTNHYYNSAVLGTFNYLGSLPCNLSKLYKSTVEQINGSLNQTAK